MEPTSKRPLHNVASKARKKPKLRHFSADDLPWKEVTRPAETGMEGDEGILELEEVDGVEVFYEETEGGKVARFRVVSQEDKGEDKTTLRNEDSDVEIDDSQLEEFPDFDSQNLLPNWHPYPLHQQLMRVIHSMKFDSPTAIQAAALPIALAQHDVIGIAQTGSGKTLAYGLPILHRLLCQPRPSPKGRRPLQALVLAPTRELALQVSSHLNAFVAPPPGFEPPKLKNGKKAPPHVSIGTIVGGMSTQKQQRVLARGVDILVATPGRLWDMIEDNDSLAHDIKNLKFLVLDEADRMIEAGHFAELENILRLTLRESKEEITEGGGHTRSDEEDTDEPLKDGSMQTFVFSATLSRDLQRNLKKRFRPKNVKKNNRKSEAPLSTLDDLLMRLDFRDPDPEVIDLSPAGGAVSTLQEAKIECLSADKDVYLYYFLLRHPGRSLVFLSSIDGIRRLMPLIELLNVKVMPLHSQLEQRQRLKNLDRFKSTQNSVLLATDIAARGLDIPAVDHVIHFQIPRSADTFIHRNGRTARASRKGFSMIMCAPDERRLVRALMNGLGREEGDIPDMSIELSLLDKLKTRVQLARQIEQEQHKIKKVNHDRNWMREAADVLGVDLDSDFASDMEEDSKPSTQKRKARDNKIADLKAELKRLLAQPLIARGVSARYITSGSRPIVDDLLAGEYIESMVGVRKTDAGDDLVMMKKQSQRKTKKKADVVELDEEEEWGGIED